MGRPLKTKLPETLATPVARISANVRDMRQTLGISQADELAIRYAAFKSACDKPVPKAKAMRLSALERAALRRIPGPRRSAAREWLGFIPLDGRARLGPLTIVAEGRHDGVAADIQELFARLLLPRSRAFFLVHNHPDGTLQASADDEKLTSLVLTICGLLGIKLLGHWVVTAHEQTLIGAGIYT